MPHKRNRKEQGRDSGGSFRTRQKMWNGNDNGHAISNHLTQDSVQDDASSVEKTSVSSTSSEEPQDVSDISKELTSKIEIITVKIRFIKVLPLSIF